MKYNDNAFNISNQYYQNIQKPKIDNIDKKWQNKLLKILLKRFKEELENNKNQNNGILKVKFKSPFWKDADEGYNLIKELVESDKFDSFASEYCIYLGQKENRCNEYNEDYFEIIWDYKSYFESMKIENFVQNTDLDKEELLKTLKTIKELPIDYQLAILKSFSEKVNEYKDVYLHILASAMCSKEGHQFSNWEKKVISNYNSESQEIIWQRVCNRCGHMEIANDEQKRLIDEQKEKRKQDEIKRLEKRLKTLKESN